MRGRVALMAERTLLLVKPDGVERRLVGEILSRIERKGLTIAALEMRIVSDNAARSNEVGARPLAAVRLGVPPPACGGEWRQ